MLKLTELTGVKPSLQCSGFCKQLTSGQGKENGKEDNSNANTAAEKESNLSCLPKPRLHLNPLLMQQHRAVLSAEATGSLSSKPGMWAGRFWAALSHMGQTSGGRDMGFRSAPALLEPRALQ